MNSTSSIRPESNVTLPSHGPMTTTSQDIVSHIIESSTGNDTTTSYRQTQRQVSSVVVSEEYLSELPEATVKFVEVPVVEEVVVHMPKRSIVEEEKIVPKYEVEYVYRTIEVPEIQYVERTVEVPQYQEVIKYVHGPVQVIENPKERLKYVSKIEIREKIVEVPEVVEAPRPDPIITQVEQPVVVAQTIRPVITESREVVDIDINEYEPQVIPVDVYVPKPIASHLIAVGATAEIHQAVRVPVPQYNTLLKSMNAHLSHEDLAQLPYLRDGNVIPFLSQQEAFGIIAPLSTAHIQVSPEVHYGSRGQYAQNTVTTRQAAGSVGTAGAFSTVHKANASNASGLPAVHSHVLTETRGVEMESTGALHSRKSVPRAANKRPVGCSC